MRGIKFGVGAALAAVMVLLGPAPLAVAATATTPVAAWVDDPPTSMSCPAANVCWANAAGSGELRRWDGNTWTDVTTPVPPGLKGGSTAIAAVTCVSASNCWAVGEVDALDRTYHQAVLRDLVVHWDGNAWTDVRVPSIPSGSLTQVSCSSANDCWAAGSYPIKENLDALQALHWNGHSWKLFRLPPAGLGPDLTALSCSQGQCWAMISTNVPDSAVGKAILLHFSRGKWAYASLPKPLSYVDTGVSCPSARTCWLVGRNDTLGNKDTAHWNGSKWAIVTTPPSPGGKAVDKYSVSVFCRTAKDCWQVGEYLSPKNPGQYHSLAMHWDGKHWKSTPTPTLGKSSLLTSITCYSANSCFALGNYRTVVHSFRSTPLLLHWNGLRWTSQPVPGTAA